MKPFTQQVSEIREIFERAPLPFKIAATGYVAPLLTLLEQMAARLDKIDPERTWPGR